MDRNDLNNDIFDRLIEYAAGQTMEDLPSSLPSDDELDREVTLRPEFEKRMELLFQTTEKPLKRARRRKKALKIVAAVAAVLIVFTSVVASVEAFRVPVLNFFLENGDGYMTIYIENDAANYDAIADKAEGLYLPGYLPEGYTVETLDGAGSFYSVVYEDNDENKIIFQKLSAGSTLAVDTEDVVVEQVNINGESAQYREKHGQGTVIFTIEDNFFLIIGSVSKNELIKIAESVRIFDS